MYDSWNSTAVSVSRRKEFWRDVSARAFVPMTPQLSRLEDFRAIMKHRTIDNVVLNEVCGPSHDMWRTPSDLARGGSPVFFLNYYHSGCASIEQNGKQIDAAPGDLLLFDSCETFKLRHPGEINLISIAVPHSLLLEDCYTLIGGPRCLASTVSAKLLISQIRALSEWSSDLQGAEALCISDTLTGLLRAAIGAFASSSSTATHRKRARGKIASLVERNYANPKYAPVNLADELGISIRTLHAWLALDGTTFGEELWTHRLERAAAMLNVLPLLEIQDVAARCGFASASQLSRRFQQMFRTTPSRFKSVR